MNIIYAQQPLEKSIFLAGPTPRKSTTTPSWRPEALRILNEQLEFKGTVFVPESEGWEDGFDYDGQINWEWEALNQATVIVFWIPRDLKHMPAFTTNVEFGMSVHSSKVVLGYPTDAPKMNYLRALAKRFNITVSHTLEQTLATAVFKTQAPFNQECSTE